jgi:anti-sigma B factor antagonist
MTSGRMTMGGDFAVVHDQTSDGLVLEVYGELDLATAPALEHELETAWARDPPALVLDLHGLRFMDSTGVRLIVATHQRALAEDKRFALRRLPRQAQRVCDLAGLTGRVPIDD